MSEGRGSPATFTRNTQPTRQDINLLHQIILRAQEDPVSQHSHKNALLKSYDEFLEANGIHVDQDGAFHQTLMKVLDPQIAPGTLYEKFENVLKDEGIELSFDDDASITGTAPVAEIVVPASPNIVNTAQVPQQQHSRPLSASSPQPWRSPASLRSGTSEPPQASNVDEMNDYIDNPPPHILRLMEKAEAKDRGLLVHQALQLLHGFRPNRNVARMSLAANHLFERNLKEKGLTQMRAILQERSDDILRATQTDHFRIKKSFSRKLVDKARIQRIQAMDEERLKGLGLYKMTIASREAHLTHKFEAVRKMRFLSKLVDHLRAERQRQIELEAILAAHQPQLDAKILASSCARVVQAAQNIQQAQHQATMLHERHMKISSLDTWHAKCMRFEQTAAHAEGARELFLKRKYLRKFQQLVETRRNRRLLLMRWAWSQWVTCITKRKHKTYDERYRLLRRKLKMNLARRLLSKVADKAREIRAAEAAATAKHQRKTESIAREVIERCYRKSEQTRHHEQQADSLSRRHTLRRALRSLTDRTHQVQRMNTKANEFHRDIPSERIAVQCLKTISRKSFELQRRRADAEECRRRFYEKRLLRMQLDRLRVALAVRRQDVPVRLPPATPSQRRAEQFNRLSSTTPLYTPAAARSAFAARLKGEGGGGGGGGLVAGRPAEKIVEELVESEEG